MTRRKVGILVFPEVEVLDFCGPFEVFSVTRLDEERRRLDPSPYEVLIIAENPGVVVATGGLKVVPDHTLGGLPSAGRARGSRRLGNPPRDDERSTDRLAQREGSSGHDVDLGLHRVVAPRQSWTAGWQTGDDPLACLGGDARIVPGCQRDRRSARRRRGQPDHLGGDLGGHRYGTAGGRPASRRCSCSGDCQVHGVPVPGGQPKAGVSIWTRTSNETLRNLEGTVRCSSPDRG